MSDKRSVKYIYIVYKMQISNKSKYVLIYVSLLATFLVSSENNIRLVLTTLTYLYTSYLFKTSKGLHVTYIILALLFVGTEYFYINHIDNTWDYRGGNILSTIPSWLLPLWMVVVAFIHNLVPQLYQKVDKITAFIL